jgi:hypothetical protein
VLAKGILSVFEVTVSWFAIEVTENSIPPESAVLSEIVYSAE